MYSARVVEGRNSDKVS